MLRSQEDQKPKLRSSFVKATQTQLLHDVYLFEDRLRNLISHKFYGLSAKP
jgi:hypothetical protein